MRRLDLRCQRHLHARIAGDVVEMKCRQCSQALGRPVYHRWDLRTGEPVDQCEEVDEAA